MDRRLRSPTTASSATTPTPASRSPTPRSASTGPGTDSGTFDYFTDAINGEEGLSRKDYQPSEDDNVLVQGVAGDEGGLGYFGFSYYEQNQDALNLVSVDERRRLRRPERRDDPGRLVRAALAAAVHVPVRRRRSQQPEVAAFVQYVADNYDTIAEAALIVPMDDTQASEAQSAVEKAVG